MDHNARIQAAIDDLRSQKRTNISATAKKWEVARETLSVRAVCRTLPTCVTQAAKGLDWRIPFAKDTQPCYVPAPYGRS
jgi:hypothetical protein